MNSNQLGRSLNLDYDKYRKIFNSHNISIDQEHIEIIKFRLKPDIKNLKAFMKKNSNISKDIYMYRISKMFEASKFQINRNYFRKISSPAITITV